MNYIKYIALMEFVDTKSIMNSISEGLGIEKGSDNIIENMGLMLLVGGALATVVLLLSVSVYFFSSNFKRYKLYRGLKQKIFYNSIIRYVLQSTLKLQIASMTTLVIANWDLAKKQMIIAGMVVIFLSLIPFAFLSLLLVKFRALWKPSSRDTIGSLYLGIKDSSKWAAAAYTPIFLMRRSFFVILTFACAD